MRVLHVLAALSALLAVLTAWWTLKRRSRATPATLSAEPSAHPDGTAPDEVTGPKIDSDRPASYGEIHGDTEEQGLDEAAHRRAAPSRRRLGARLALFVLLLLSLAVGGLYTATSVVVHVDNVLLPGVDIDVPGPVSRVLPNLDSTPIEGSPGTTRINVLVLGVDRRPHHDPNVDGPPNADSIHIISLDPITKTATALSLPRDLYVEAPSPEQTKGDFWPIRINTAYRLGEEYGYPGGGAAFAKRVVE